MKKQYKNAIFPSLFIAFVTCSGYLIYSILLKVPHEVMVILGLNESSEKYDLLTAYLFNSTFWIAIAVMLCGLAMTSYLLMNSKTEEKANVIYVEKTVNKNSVENTQNQAQLDTDEQFLLDLTTQIRKFDSQIEKSQFLLSVLAKHFEACMGAIYLGHHKTQERYLEFLCGYAYQIPDSQKLRLEFGEGLTGQVAKEKNVLRLSHVPMSYSDIKSGLGQAAATSLLIVPIINSYEQTQYVIELAAFKEFSVMSEQLVKRAGASLFL